MKTRLCLALMVAIFFASCHSSFQIEKRRYRPGWHVHFSDNKIKSPTIDNKGCIEDDESTESVPLVAELPRLSENKEPIPAQDNLSTQEENEPNNSVARHEISSDLEQSNPVKKSHEQVSSVSTTTKKTPTRSTRDKRWMAGVYAAASGLALAGLSKATRKNQRQISKWAARNKTASRLCLAAGQMVVLTGFLNIGHELAHLGIGTGKLWTPAWLCAGAALALGYPMKSSALNYARRKKMDLGLMFCLSMLSLDLGNRHKMEPDSLCSTSNNVIGMLTPESCLAIDICHAIYAASSLSESSYMPLGIQIVLIIAMTLILIILFRYTAAIACSLACSGQGALAAIVLLGGFVLVIYIEVIFIKWVVSQSRSRRIQVPDSLVPAEQE